MRVVLSVAFVMLSITFGSCQASQSSVQDWAGGEILPAQPVAFEQVFLVLPVPEPASLGCSTMYSAELHDVFVQDGRIEARAFVNVGAIVSPGDPGYCTRFLVPLGRFPRGHYPIRLQVDDGHGATLSFDYTVEIHEGSGSDGPAFDYSGLYWDPNESGSGLQVTQGADGTLGAVWFTYDSDGRQQWVAIAGGRWESRTLYVGTAFVTLNGVDASSPPPEEPLVAEQIVIGEARLGFGLIQGADPFGVWLQVLEDGEVVFSRAYERFEMKAPAGAKTGVRVPI